MQKIEFVDEDNRNYIVSVPVVGQEKQLRLRMWVAYDRGNRYSYNDCTEIKRGYYLYFSLEEPSGVYPARIISTGNENCRVYLGEVSRHSKNWYKEFSILAERIVLPTVEEIFPDMRFAWEELYTSSWDGTGSGVGMYCDFYRIVSPKEKWLRVGKGV